MLIHYFKIAFRNILKDKGYSLVNILGLSVALACCFLLIFWVRNETSYERSYKDAKSIYQLSEVQNKGGELIYKPSIRPGIYEQIKAEFPQIEYSTFLSRETLPFTIADEDDSSPILAGYVTTNKDFLRIFNYEFTEGSLEEVIKKGGCVMSEETAEKFFGNESAVGKTVTFGHTLSCTIDAVVKIPRNTNVRFDILDIGRSSENGFGTHYIKLNKNIKITDEFRSQVAGFLGKIRETENTLELTPLVDLHLRPPGKPNKFGEGPLGQVYLFSLAAFLILLVAIINYVNTSIARSLNRMKEVGVRKVNGALKEQLLARFFVESFIISFAAVILSLLLAKAFFPEFSQLMGNKISLDIDFEITAISLIVCVLCTLLSGGYAAFYMSSFKPAIALKGGSKTGSKEGMRKVLLGVQFFLSTTILICTLFIYKQINAIFNSDTGVDRKNIIIMETGLWYQVQPFIDVIKNENPNIIDASIAFQAPYNASLVYGGNVSWEGSPPEANDMVFTQILADHNYGNVFGLEVVQGQFIPPGLTWWQYATDDSHNIVINETFKKFMGVDNPIGMSIGGRGRIIGVVKDFNFKPLKEPITPLIIGFNPEACGTVYVKTNGEDMLATWEYLVKKHDEMKTFSLRPMEYKTVEEEYKNMYAGELRTLKILSFFAVISFILSLMGVVSMISFMVEKRTKEIAIRKINGAGIESIIKLFGMGIAKIAGIASVISIPLCYFIMSRWLETYVYRTPLSWWVFVCIPLAIIIITLAVIAVQVYLTARRRPVESLRSE